MSSPTFTSLVQSQIKKFHHGITVLKSRLQTGEVEILAVEKAIHAMSRKLAQGALEAIISEMGAGDMGASIEVKRNGEAVTFERRRLEKLELRSVFGSVIVERWRYVNADGNCLYPLDAKLQLSQKSVTPMLQEWLVMLAAQSSYNETQETIEEMLGLSMSIRTIENSVEHRAQEAEEFQAQVVSEEAAPEKLIVVQFDAKGITMRRDVKGQRKKRLPGQKANKRKMATIATIHESDPLKHDIPSICGMTVTRNKSRPRPENKLVRAHISDRQMVLDAARRSVEQRLSGGARVVILIDGCPKLESAVRKTFKGIDALYILDWYHLSEYLWDAVKSLDAGDPKAMDSRYQRIAERILNGEWKRVAAGMKQSVSKRGNKGMSLVKKAIRYLETHASMLNYDQAIRIGSPIATGAVEGACAHVIRSRMQRPGMRWSQPGAQSVLDLRCINSSDQREAHHIWFREQETARLHGWLKNARQTA